MGEVFADRVAETTTIVGTGTIDLGGVITGFRTFVTGIGNGNTCRYLIIDEARSQWEVGLGTVTDAAPDTLSRDVVESSSTGGAKVDFAAGTKNVIHVMSVTAFNEKAPKASPVFTGNVTLAGNVVNATLPAFLVYNSANDADVTGDATEYTIICDTEIHDRGANHNSATGIFTAPVAGVYMFCAVVYISQLAAAHNVHSIRIVTSNRTYYQDHTFAAAANPYIGGKTMVMSVEADMDAADTATLLVMVSGGTKIVDIYGSATPYTCFSGHLIC